MKSKPASKQVKSISPKVDSVIRQLVLARMRATPKNLKISIGSGEYSTEELLHRIEQGDEIGNQVIEMQMNFLRDMARGEIYNEDE